MVEDEHHGTVEIRVRQGGVATSSRPVSEDTSVMGHMIPHIRAPWGAGAGSAHPAQLSAGEAREERAPAGGGGGCARDRWRRRAVTDPVRSVL